MEKKPGDRRVRRTQRLLKASLLELMKEKPFSSITVADIAEKADVNRATFYLHFSNPAHLLQSIGDDLLEKLQELFDEHQDELVGSESIRPVLEPVLDFVIAFQELCTLLFDHAQESQFPEKLLVLIQENGAKLVKALPEMHLVEEAPYLVAFLAYGVNGILQTWVRCGMEVSKEGLLEAAERMTDGVLSQYQI